MPLDNHAELFYLVDENDNVLGSIPRGEAHKDRTKIHRSVSIVLINDQGQVLLQKRSIKKDIDPEKWTVSASGHLTFGQGYEDAAYRELAEEIGVTDVHLELKLKKLFPLEREQEIASIYVATYNDHPTKLDPDEVTEVMWVTVAELEKLHSEQQLTLMAGMVLESLGLLKK